MRRFVVATTALAADEEKQLKDALGGVGWWHWLPNFWLVVDPADNLDATAIAEKVGSVNESAQCLVIEVDHKQWAARSQPDGNGRRLTDWLPLNWSKPKSG